MRTQRIFDGARFIANARFLAGARFNADAAFIAETAFNAEAQLIAETVVRASQSASDPYPPHRPVDSPRSDLAASRIGA